MNNDHSTVKVDSFVGPLNLEPIRTDNLYPVAEEHMDKHRHDRVIWTGEKRPPKAGEWYLSGSPIEGYIAPNALTQRHYIGRLVEGEIAWRPKDISNQLMVGKQPERPETAGEHPYREELPETD
jgi:hypothetical protein